MDVSGAPPRRKIFSILCIFFLTLAKLYVGVPPRLKICSISCSFLKFWQNFMPVLPSHGPKFSQFHAVFGKIWQNCMLVPSPPPWPKNFLNFMQFFGNFGKIVSWQLLESQRHLQWEILNQSPSAIWYWYQRRPIIISFNFMKFWGKNSQNKKTFE